MQKSNPIKKMRVLKNRAQFLRAAKGKRISRASFSLQMIKSNNKENLDANKQISAGIGYTITKKVGNSPERNRIKRRFRAIVAQCSNLFEQNYDYVLIGRRKALYQPFAELVSDLRQSIVNIHKTKNTIKANKIK